jgi:hypothetical protein
MNRIAIVIVAIATNLLTTACGGSNDASLCDRAVAESAALSAKAGSCVAPGALANILPSTPQICTTQLAPCSATDRGTLSTFVTCLEGLPTCTSSTSKAWAASLQACSAPLSGLSSACINGRGTTGVTDPTVTTGPSAVLPFPVETTFSAIAADATGRLHTAATGHTGADYTSANDIYLRYGTCSSGCGQAANWSSVQVDLGTNFEALVLRVLPDGRPRIFASGKYYECNSGCLTASNWSKVALPQPGFSTFPSSYAEHEYFAVSPASGAAAVVFQGDGHTLNLAQCASSCAQAANWTVGQVGSLSLLRANLVFFPSGGLALSMSSGDTRQYWPTYLECRSGCGQPVNWSQVQLPKTSTEERNALTIDSHGRPRLAVLYPDGLDATASDRLLLYSCDADCGQSTNWNVVHLPLPLSGSLVYTRVSLAFDASGRGRVAYRNADTAWLATCESGCTGSANSWSGSTLVTGSMLDKMLPFLHTCATSLWAFWVGDYQVVALPNGSWVAALDIAALQKDPTKGLCGGTYDLYQNEFRSLIIVGQ